LARPRERIGGQHCEPAQLHEFCYAPLVWRLIEIIDERGICRDGGRGGNQQANGDARKAAG
jgi:hypothetical protein